MIKLSAILKEYLLIEVRLWQVKPRNLIDHQRVNRKSRYSSRANYEQASLHTEVNTRGFYEIRLHISRGRLTLGNSLTSKYCCRYLFWVELVYVTLKLTDCKYSNVSFIREPRFPLWHNHFIGAFRTSKSVSHPHPSPFTFASALVWLWWLSLLSKVPTYFFTILTIVFNDIMSINRLSELLLDELIQDVAIELGGVCDEYTENIFTKEFVAANDSRLVS